MNTKKHIETLLAESMKIGYESPQDAYKIAIKAYELAEVNCIDSEMANALYHMAYACRIMSDYINGLEHALKALDIFKAIEDELGVMKVRNIIGINYFYFGDYTSALENFMNALEYLETNKNPSLESSILNNMGEIYREADQEDEALKYYGKALKISNDNNLELNASSIYLNIGEVLYRQNKVDESLVNIEKAYDIAIKYNRMITQGEAETKLGRAMFIQGKYDLAQKYYFSALTKFNKVNNKFYLIELLINLSKLDEAMGMSPVKYLNEALNTAAEMKLESKISLVYKLLAEYYERTHQFKNALDYYKSYHMAEKEVDVTNLSKRLQILSIEFNYYKAKRENEKFKDLSEKLRRNIENSNKEIADIKKKNESLIKESIIDELTQLYNRRGIYKLLSKHLNEEDDLLVAIFIIDIDYFKKYNDYWGHIQGDVCLKMIAGCLKDLPYKDYFAGRFGGEEFLCFMKGQEVDEVKEAAEHIRQCVASLKLPYSKEHEDHHITISIGGKVGEVDSDNINQFINQADKELYKAKKNGRNRICINSL